MTHSIQKLFRERFHLEKMWMQAKELTKLGQLFKSVVGDDLKDHCSLAKVKDEKILVIVDNASWATRLHFEIPEILKILKMYPEFKRIKKIEYAVAKNPLLIKKNSHRKKVKLKLTKDNAVLLQNFAKKSSSKSLSLALQKLASNCKKKGRKG